MIGRVTEIQTRMIELSQPLAAKTTAAATASATTTATAKSAESSAAFAEVLTAVSAAADPNESTGVSLGNVTNPKNATGDDVAAATKKYVGIPYVWGGNDESGMDCSGFVKKVFADLGVDMPRIARDQINQGAPVASFADAKPGDLISSFNGAHISIYLGDGKAIDAPVPGKTIQIRDAWEMGSNLDKITRIIPSGTAAAPATPAPAAAISSSQAAFLSGLSS